MWTVEPRPGYAQTHPGIDAGTGTDSELGTDRSEFTKPIVIRRQQELAYANDVTEAMLAIGTLFENNTREFVSDILEFEAAGHQFHITIRPIPPTN